MSDLPNQTPADPKKSKWYYSVWGVLVLLANLGPFAFPFLWKSNRFSLFWKWFLTLVVTSLVIVLAWLIWVLALMVMERFRAAGLLL